MRIEIVNKLILKGNSIITNNKNEMNPQTSKIPKLWEIFYKEDYYNKSKKRKIDSLIYGVYSDYESDVLGNFKVTSALEINDDEEENSININNQKYLVFSKKGELPQAVIDLWIEIWKYFEENNEYIRAYTIDFEKYLNDNEVEVYIAIK